MNLNELRDTWTMFQKEHGCSVDRMLCSPALRTEFLNAATSATRCADEEKLLWAVVGLRKSKRLASAHK